jgi:hypothetical protein
VLELRAVDSLLDGPVTGLITVKLTMNDSAQVTERAVSMATAVVKSSKLGAEPGVGTLTDALGNVLDKLNVFMSIVDTVSQVSSFYECGILR